MVDREAENARRRELRADKDRVIPPRPRQTPIAAPLTQRLADGRCGACRGWIATDHTLNADACMNCGREAAAVVAPVRLDLDTHRQGVYSPVEVSTGETLMGRPKTPKFQAFCIDCESSAGWVEGRGRVTLRCYPCSLIYQREYNRIAQAKHRMADRLARSVKV